MSGIHKIVGLLMLSHVVLSSSSLMEQSKIESRTFESNSTTNTTSQVNTTTITSSQLDTKEDEMKRNGGKSGFWNAGVVKEDWKKALNMDAPVMEPTVRRMTHHTITSHSFWANPIPKERESELTHLMSLESSMKDFPPNRRNAKTYTIDEMTNKITFLIKTFERSNCVHITVSSIRRMFPKVSILIADDSRDTTHTREMFLEDENISFFSLPFDSGLSAARNLLIDNVHTPYAVVMDDDVMLTELSNIENLIADLENSGAHITGGCVNERGHDSDCVGDNDMFYKDKLPTPRNEIEYSTIEVRSIDHHFMEIITQRDGKYDLEHSPHCKESDMVTNFFLARTSFLSKIRFDPFFKVGGDLDFFFRAKQNQGYIRFCTNVQITHKYDTCVKRRDDEQRYNRFQNRHPMFLDYFFVKHAPIRRLETSQADITWLCDCDDPIKMEDSNLCGTEQKRTFSCRSQREYRNNQEYSGLNDRVFNAGNSVEDGLVYLRDVNKADAISAMPPTHNDMHVV